MVRVHRQLPPMPAVHVRRFGLLGLPLVVRSNDPRLLDLAGTSFGRYPIPDSGEPLELTLLVERATGRPVENTAAASRPTGDVHRFDDVAYRAHGTTAVITGRGHDVATLDVAAGRGVAVIGEAALDDLPGLRYAIVEAATHWMVAYARGYLTVHASGVARDGIGLIIGGHAGAGKSTLAVAAARRGLSVFAEDAVFSRVGADGLESWGTPWVQRLLPDGRALFPELDALPVVMQPNGERKLEVDLDSWFPGTATPSARPGALVVLAREPGATTELLPLPSPNGDLEVLWPYDLDWRPAQHAVAEALERLPAYRLIVGGTPDEALDVLADLLARLTVAATASPSASPVG